MNNRFIPINISSPPKKRRLPQTRAKRLKLVFWFAVLIVFWPIWKVVDLILSGILWLVRPHN